MKKKIIALLLTAVMLFGITVPAYAQSYDYTDDHKIATALVNGEYQLKTTCGGDCDNTPTIIIHGMAQSTVLKCDENGNVMYNEDGEARKAWPLEVEVMPLVKNLLFPVLKTLLFQKDYVSDALRKSALDIFKYNTSDDTGRLIENTQLVVYPYSVAACTQEEKNELYGTIPLNDYCKVCNSTEDHLYYFMYDSFGNSRDIANDLAEFINMVKAETGHDKVNLCPISLGGTVMNMLMGEHFDEICNSLDKIIYIVPAADGSRLVNDLYLKKFCMDDESLYSTMLPSLVEGWTGYLINVALRILKNEVIISILNTVLDTLVDDILVKCTNMWALTCEEDYDVLYDTFFGDGQLPEIAEQVESYHNAQVNREENLMKLVNDYGVEVYDIVDTDFSLYQLVPSWKEVNADGLLSVYSTSLGAECPDGFGATFDDAYMAAHEGDAINPERTVNASKGLFPETTWYFYGQDHEGTARNDIILNLAMDILAGHITKVSPEEDKDSEYYYPQFMYSRETKGIRRSELPDAKKALESGTLKETDRTRLQAAVDAADAVLARHDTTTDEYLAVEEELYAALVQAGLREDDGESWFEAKLYDIFKGLSDKLYAKLGNRGFCEIFRK